MTILTIGIPGVQKQLLLLLKKIQTEAEVHTNPENLRFLNKTKSAGINCVFISEYL
jgi:hypothetical protein